MEGEEWVCRYSLVGSISVCLMMCIKGTAHPKSILPTDFVGKFMCYC